MKKLWLIGLAGLLTVILAVPAFAAGIDNSHHSMKDYLLTGAKYTCYACHGMNDANPQVTTLGSVGSLCYNRCHIGTGGLAGAPAAINLGVAGVFNYTTNAVTTSGSATNGLLALQNGHGMLWASLPGIDSYSTVRSALTWPYMTAARMECTTCHDVHNNTYAPFLRAPLSMADTANEHGVLASPSDTFCIKCHGGQDATGTGRYNLIANAPNGVHPIEIGSDNISGAIAANRPLPRHTRTIAFKGGATFMTSTVWGTALNGLDSAVDWVMGGKLGGTAATGKVIGCYTCHQVHMDSLRTAPTGQTFRNLTGMAYTDNNVRTNAGGDDLCVGCHGTGTGGNAGNENPGTTQYLHPVNNSAVSTNISDTGNALYRVTTPAGFTIAVNMTGKIYGASGRLVCTSCHAPAHASAPVAGSMILSPNAPKCASCHNPTNTQWGTVPNSHHVYGGSGINYTTGSYNFTNPSFRTGNDNNVDLADGLQCNDCHVFNNTAHNWN